MDAARWAKLRVLFDEWTALTATQRVAWCANLAQSEPQLLAELEPLMAADGSSDTHQWTPLAAQRVQDAQNNQLLGVGSLVGQWRLLEMLGEGGMGSVFLAQRVGVEFQQRAAVKVLRFGCSNSELQRRFVSEQRMLAALQHPHIAHFVEGGISSQGMPYLVLEYVDGLSLTAYVNQHTLSVTERIRLFLQVCSAVEHAHQQLIVHRDLKPSNILVDAQGAVKLLDFGIGKLLSELDQDQGLTSTGVRLFTLGYGAPEQLRGDPVSTATDVYALGVVLYQLLTGELPFAVKSLSAVDWERVALTQEPTPPSRIETSIDTTQPVNVRKLSPPLPAAWHGDIDAIILKALRKEPPLRYSSVAALRADLEALLAGKPVAARQGSRRYRAHKFLRRHALILALGGGAAIALITGSALALWQASAAREARDRAQAQSEQASLEARRARATVDFLTNVFASADPGHVDGADPSARDLLVAGEAELNRATDLDSATRTSLTIAIARAHMGLNDPETMLRLIEGVQADARASASPRLQIDALLNLGIAYNRLSRHAEALRTHQQALQVLQRSDLNDPVIEARIDRLMATELTNLDRDAEALSYVQRAHRQLLEHAGPLSQEVVDTLDVHLALLNSAGRSNETLAVTTPSFTALSSTNKIPKARHAQILATHAVALRSQNQLPAAEAAIREALQLQASVLGAKDLGMTATMTKLVAILRDQKKFAQSAEVAEQVLKIRRAALEPGNRSVLFALRIVSLAQFNLGNFERARSLVEEALAGYDKLNLQHSANAIDARLLLVQILMALDDTAAARANLLTILPHASVLMADEQDRVRQLRVQLGMP